MNRKPPAAERPLVKPPGDEDLHTSRRRDGSDPEHVVKTGLPPGISIDDAKDPGSAATNKTPVDNRS